MIKYDIDKLFFMKRLNNKGKYTLEEIIIKYDLTKFDFIYKASDQFRRIYYDEFINEKYSVYYFRGCGHKNTSNCRSPAAL